MREYKYEEILAFLRATVAKKGETFVYTPRKRDTGVTGCYYEYQGAPDCGIGKMLHDQLGVSLDLLVEMDTDQHASAIQDQYPRLALAGFAFETRARLLMEYFQGYQDDGASWGEALALAERFVGSRK